MGDRVAIIGGSTVGRDHFPWILTDSSDVGDGTERPFTLAVDRLASVFYCIKKWRVRYTYTFHDLDTTVHDRFAEFDIVARVTNDVESDIWSPPTREADWTILIRSEQVSILTDGTDFNYFECDPSTGAFDVTNFSTDAPEEANILRLNLHPPFSRWAAGAIWCYVIVHGVAGNQEFNSIGLGREIGTLSLNDGRGTNHISTVYAKDDGPGDNQLDAMSVSFNPIEFWPYSTRSGLPVYDTSTGVALRDPLS